ncbi:MAG: HAD family hydrolase [Ruminococcaceae bacterium]|nr:HAD family hydrolase [Oscillospiraceae bacterium]
MVKGAIFDLDGTLFDSMGIWEDAGEKYLSSLGYKAKEGLGLAIKDMNIDQAAAYLKKEYILSEDISYVIEGINKTVREGKVRLKNGAKELLIRFENKNIKMCIATSNSRVTAERYLEEHGIKDFFFGILCCDELKCTKRNAFVYEKALDILGTERKETLVFEDAFCCIKAAKEGGFKVAAVYDLYEEKQEEIKALADVYMKDFENVKELWEFIER